MSESTLLLARPTSSEEWMQIDRVCNGLLNWSEVRAQKFELGTAPVWLVRPQYSPMNWVIVVEGKKRSLPWDCIEELIEKLKAKGSVHVWCYGESFSDADRKRLQKIVKKCEDWKGIEDDSLMLASLP